MAGVAALYFPKAFVASQEYLTWFTWWQWFLIAAGFAVILILSGASRVIKEENKKRESELVIARSEYEQSLTSMRQQLESRTPLSPDISVQVKCKLIQKTMIFQIEVTNIGNTPITCHAIGIPLSVPTKKRDFDFTPYPICWAHDKNEHHDLLVNGDKDTLDVLLFGTAPYIRFTHWKLPFGWAPQLVFFKADKVHSEFYMPVPLMMGDQPYGILEAPKLLFRPTLQSWHVQPNISMKMKVRISYMSLIDRSIGKSLEKIFTLKFDKEIPIFTISDSED